MKRVRASVVNLFYMVVILVAAIKSAIFGITLYAENHNEGVEQIVSQLVGKQIHIQQINSSWSGLLPKLRLKNLSIGEGERLYLGDVQVNINTPSLPWWKTNPPLDIRLEGTRIHVLREPSGEIRILGLADSNLKDPLLPAHIHIKNGSILLQDNKHGGATLELQHVDVHLTSRDQQSRLVINSARDELLIRSDLQGNILGSDWSADSYVRTSMLEASAFANPYLPKRYKLDKLKLGLESWSQWRRGRHVASQAKIQLQQMDLRNSDGRRLTMDTASADMQFRRNRNHWQLQFSDFNIESTEGKWSGTDILLDLSTSEATMQRLRIGASQIPIRVLNRLSVIFRPLGDLDELLARLSPTGELHGIHAHLVTGTNHEIGLQQLSADFSGVSSRAWKKIPAISNFSGHIRGNSRQIQLDLDTSDADILFPGLFRTPLPLSLVQGRVNWQSGTTGNWQINSDKLKIDSPDLKTISRIAIQKQPDKPLFVDLQTDFRDGFGANAGTYYPVGIMNPNLVDWLDTSIVSGRVPSGSFLLHGPLDGFPYHKTHAGHFEILFDAEDLLLDYLQDWFPLNNSFADIRFYNNELHVNLSSAQLLNTKVVQAGATIPSLKPASSINIQGQASGPLADALRLVRETPLKKKFSSAVAGMLASGNTKTDLKLSIPLSRSADYEFEGQLMMRDAGLKLTQHRLDLSNIQGRLNLNLNGISASGIKFNSLGGNMQMDIDQSAHRSTLIDITGIPSIAAVQKHYPYLKPIEARGKAPVAIQLDIPNNNELALAPVSVRIRSNLKGITLDMPAPFAKSSNIPRPLNLSLLLNTPKSDIRINYAKQIQLHVTQDDAADYHIAGSIRDVPLDDWLGWFARMEPKGGPNSFDLKQMDLSVDHLSVGAFTASELQLSVRKNHAQWLGEIQSDRLQGSFTIPSDLSAQPLVVALDKLSLPVVLEADQDKPDPLPVDTLNPVVFPAIDFSCKELMIDDARLGKVEINTRKTTDGMIIDSAGIHGRHIDSQISGSWLNGSNGTLTRIKGNLKSRDMGHLLQKIYAATPLAGSETTVDFDLSWTAAPFQYHPVNAQGIINLDIGEGRVLDLDPGGAGRLLGLMNVRSLNRRLRLDFSDLYKEGMSFDNVQGSFQLGNGHIYSNDLTIISPSALIQISGSADLVDRQYDQLIAVSPKLDATLPVAGAIVGGPATGLAVLLAQQVMYQPLSKLQRIDYNLQGSWDNPVITPIQHEQKRTDSEDILDL